MTLVKNTPQQAKRKHKTQQEDMTQETALTKHRETRAEGSGKQQNMTKPTRFRSHVGSSARRIAIVSAKPGALVLILLGAMEAMKKAPVAKATKPKAMKKAPPVKATKTMKAMKKAATPAKATKTMKAMKKAATPAKATKTMKAMKAMKKAAVPAPKTPEGADGSSEDEVVDRIVLDVLDSASNAEQAWAMLQQQVGAALAAGRLYRP